MSRTVATRERILKAAFELISSRGYLGASTRDIARRAHVAEVTLFRHFASKEVLFAEILGSFSTIPVLTEEVVRVTELPFDEALTVLAERFTARLEANREWVRILTCEIQHASPSMQNVYNDFLHNLFRLLTDFFLDAQHRGAISSEMPAEHIARAFHSLLFGYVQVEGTRGTTLDSGRTHDEVLASFIKILCRGAAVRP